MNQHQEPVHLNYCGRLDAIDPKQRIVFSLFLFSLGFARSRKIYQKKSREIWDKQTLHLGHLLQVPTQLCRRELYPLDPLGALQSETTCLPCLPEAQQFLYKLQSSAIICNHLQSGYSSQNAYPSKNYHVDPFRIISAGL